MPRRDSSEEEEEEYEEPAKKRGQRDSKEKRKRRRVTSFLDTEAQEDDAEGDEYEGEEDDGGFLDDMNEAEEAQELELAQRRQLNAAMAEGGTKGRTGGAGHLASAIGALERRFQNEEDEEDQRERYEGEPDEDELDDEYGLPMQNDVSHLLPSAGSWRLWRVPTMRPGVEREACIEILKLFGSLTEAQRENFQIGTAFASDAIRGSVYIEASSPLYIIDTLKGIRSLWLARNRIQAVPISEMADIFQMGTSNQSFPKRGDWVRFARGVYAGDIALVSDTDELHQTVTVRVVPRIDLNWEIQAMKAEEMGQAKIAPPRNRPPAVPIFASDLSTRGIDCERVNHMSESFKFRSYILEEATGYLFKVSKVTTLITGEKVKPTSLEIETFTDHKDLAQLFGDLNIEQPSKTADGDFEIGQRVLIVAGDLKGITGKVMQVDAHDQLKIKPDDPELIPVTISPNDIVKQFDLGESVKVTGGKHEGEQGLVVRLDVDQNLAYVLSTESHQQISCSLGHLTAIPNDKMVASGLTKIDGYSVGDLVQISGSPTVGIIVRLFKTRRVDVLAKSGIITCDIARLAGKKMLRLTKGVDASNKQFGTGASVEVLEGTYAKRIGTVKAIWKDTVFLSIPAAVETGGLVAADTQVVRVLQGSETGADTNTQGGNPASGHNGRPQRQRGYGQPSFSAAFHLMGTPVKVVQGPQKGMNGEIRNFMGPEVLVLVSALGKEIRFPRSWLQVLDSKKSANVARFLSGPGDHR